MTKITKEKILEYMESPSYRPMTARELMWVFKPRKGARFKALLHRLEKKGEVILTDKGRFMVPSRIQNMIGRVQANLRGFAFVIPEAKEKENSEISEDIYISAENLNGAMHQDRVEVRILKPKGVGRPEGEVIRILERANQRIVGTYQYNGRLSYVVPDSAKINWNIKVLGKFVKEVHSGDKVVVELTRFPEQDREPEGRIIEILGPGDAPGVDILSIIRKHDLPEKFPDQVLQEARDVFQEVQEEEIIKRYDLRNLRIVTIDGEDAKDLDDAVSIELLDNGNYLLGVHIADVSYYVKEGSALDREALKRGTSVYLVDRVIPMLPPELSNGICSLNEKVERLTMSVFMEIDKNGERIAYSLFPSVIQTSERMTYTNVRKILVDHDAEVIQRYDYLVEDFTLMEKLAAILKKRRISRGALDFNLPECKVKLDDQGRPVELYRYPRSIADGIIEEFMLAANETVAEHLSKQKLPGIYRIHEEPDQDKIEEVNRSLQVLGYYLNQKQKLQARIQHLLKQVKGRQEERVVNTLLLRSMMHARYAPQPLGHFGLAVKYYTHFTSPIRRYPDLIVHRILRYTLPAEGYFYPYSWRPLQEIKKKVVNSERGNYTEDNRLLQLAERIPQIAEHTSIRERIAEEVERESIEKKKVEYMLQHVGNDFDGVISGVTPYGLYVELDNLVEGLVHVSSIMDDYYIFIENPPSFVGEHTRQQFRIGDKVRVKVVRVDAEQNQVDFILLD